MKTNVRVRLGMGLICAFALHAGESSGHNPVLPRPQQVRYGTGQLPLRGLTIRFASNPDPEDRFTAQELSASLSKITGGSIPVSVGSARGPAIALRRTGPVDPLPVPGEKTGPESREAFSLHVTPTGAEIAGRSSAAVYYGAQTLLQMVETGGAGAALPEVEVHDWPSLAYRGVMIDTSHGPLPTEDEIKREIDLLARFKSNQYYLYSEASIELEGSPLLNSGAQYSPDQVRRIVAYARQRHIDVVPCMELYGHLHDLFRSERFSGLGMRPHGREFNPRNPEVPALISKWTEQLADLFPSPFFHIGFDETSEAGIAPGDRVPPATLYMEHFRQVSDSVRRHGKTVLVWSDMFAKYPELIPQIPPGTIVVPWGYDRTVYEPYWKPFAESALPRFIATGVSIWDQVAPNFPRSFDNIDNFVATGRRHGVLGLINTIWTDDIAVLIRPAFPGIAYGAAAAWQAGAVDRASFFADYSRIMYPAAVAAQVAPALDALGRSEVALGKAISDEWENTSPSFWDDPLKPAHLARAVAHREQFRNTRLLAEEAAERLTRALRLGGDGATLSDFLLEARMLDYVGMKNIYAAEIADLWKELGAKPSPEKLELFVHEQIISHDHSRIADLMDASGDLGQSYRTAWNNSYTSYRLGTVLGKWDAEFQYWWKLQRRLDEFVGAFHNGDALPALESLCPAY